MVHLIGKLSYILKPFYELYFAPYFQAGEIGTLRRRHYILIFPQKIVHHPTPPSILSHFSGQIFQKVGLKVP